MKINTWTTAKGAAIEMHTKHVTETTWTDDWGTTHSKPDNFVIIDKVVVNDNVYRGQGLKRTNIDGQQCIHLYNDMATKTKIHVQLPDDVNQAVWGEYDRIESAKAERRKAAAKADREELQTKIRNGYCTKCHSYCYGDCQA
ncbi:hypothetical protein ACE41H_15630 [Paenibacillus enshidis]|uniref:Uncharacterized protein n=1 Tax=Paenibacillus enshidis TaxID=1458439 RepID=A0ABV5AVH8_9BACL